MPTPQAGDFTPQAHAYARARPGYPTQLLDDLIRHVRVSTNDPIADIGAGTGLFTALLAQRNFHVTAIEPGAAMREQAPLMNNVTWREGTFESTGLPDASQRWITAAQAFHWADPARALPELRRVLVPGGSLTVLWNNRENQANPIPAWTRAAITQHVPDFTHAYRDTDWSAVLTSTGDFADVTTHETRHIVTMPRDRYLDLWRSHNRLNTIAGPQRFAAFMQDLTAYLDQQNADTIDVPYLCKAWTVQRKP